MSRAYSRGLNFMGQLGLSNKKTNVAQFQEIKSLAGRQIVQAEAYLAQSACLLGDGQILNWGWPLDSLTTARTLSYYKRAPALAKFWQKYSIFGGTLGMRSGVDEPILLNKGLLMKHKPTKFSLGGCYLLCLTSDGDVYGSGENYKGQLGTGDIKFKFDFAIIPRSGGYKMVDISTGFQHSLALADDGSCYASGRTNWRQFLPYFTKPEDKQIQYDFYRSPQKIIFPGEKILKASAGFSHSLFYTSKDKLYAIGLNNFGQCGQSSLNRTSLSDYIEVFMDLEHDERIVDIKCGKSHNIFLTNKGNVYGFGASSHNQLNWRNEADLEVCAPRKIVLPLQDENVVKIKATLDRNAVITDKGNCYVWGGEDFSKIGGEKNGELENLRDSLPGKPRVKDVGLGFMHTIAVTED